MDSFKLSDQSHALVYLCLHVCSMHIAQCQYTVHIFSSGSGGTIMTDKNSVLMIITSLETFMLTLDGQNTL